MTKAGRAWNVILGIIIILAGCIIFVFREDAYVVIITVLGLSLVVDGVRKLVVFAKMARHMVGGRSILYRAVITLDIGLFTLSMNHVPAIILVMYLAGIHGFAGIIDILRAAESRKLQAPRWKLEMSTGLVNVIMALLCLVFLKQVEVAVVIYSVGLIYSGLIRIIQAFRRTAVIYIQ
ncbi:MAG: DUF308 domain-containing protein [Firmicutes bacterium]|nr:DUF308 domain-containing protein [Bacillota bacterium]